MHAPTAAGPAPTPTFTLARGDQPEIDLTVKRSRFLARAARADNEEEARGFVAAVRAHHPDARHHCSAFTVPSPGALAVERSSDDGEPSGTAGGPMLKVLRSAGLSATAVVVTRYFGGTLLGTGGLVRAYSQATARALAVARRVRLTTRHLWEVHAPVADAGRLEAGLRDARGRGAHDLTVEGITWGPNHAVLTLATDSPDAVGLDELLAALTGGGAEPRSIGPVRPSALARSGFTVFALTAATIRAVLSVRQGTPSSRSTSPDARSTRGGLP